MMSSCAISSREKKPTSVVSSLSPSVPPMMAVRKLADTVCHRCRGSAKNRVKFQIGSLSCL
jgi:hypothetical protein